MICIYFSAKQAFILDLFEKQAESHVKRPCGGIRAMVEYENNLI